MLSSSRHAVRLPFSFRQEIAWPASTPDHRCQPADPPESGDLMFFGDGPSSIDHIGIVVMPGVMVDAPYTGADVREDMFPTRVGAALGDMTYVGATHPGA